MGRRRSVLAHVRVCRECGEEFRPEIAVCSDCGGALEDRHDDEDAPAPALPEDRPPEPEDLSGYRQVFTTGRAADLVPVAERLREAGIPFRLHEAPRSPEARAAVYSLLVPDAEAGSALRELAPLLGGDDAAELHAVESEFGGGSYVRCPACRADLPKSARECPECGLGLGTEGDGEPGPDRE